MLDLKSFLKQHPEMLKSKNALYSVLIDIYPNEKCAAAATACACPATAAQADAD